SAKQVVAMVAIPGLVGIPVNASRQQGGPERHSRRVLDPGVDCFINADHRADLKCRCKVFDMYFNNTLAEFDHLSCQSGQPLGCDCCHICEPVVFCDIHNPEEFIGQMAHMSKFPPAPQHSQIRKYTWESSDHSHHEALDNWHEEKTILEYGWPHLKDIGPCVIMTDETVNWIVDCAHYHKVQSLADLKKETGWVDIDQFSNEIIELINTHSPLPATPFVSTPLRPTTMSGILNVDSPPSMHHPSVPFVDRPPTKHAIRCSACSQEDHNACNQACPNHPSGPTANKENI
ncbi:hypothetical protein SCLCIDRAFT_122899, partial [Scleroderma citrinum Foug A]